MSGFSPNQHHQCKVDLWVGKSLLPSPAQGFHPDSPGKKQSRSHSRCVIPVFFPARVQKCLYSRNVSFQTVPGVPDGGAQGAGDNLNTWGLAGNSPSLCPPGCSTPPALPWSSAKLSGASLTKSRTIHCHVFPARSIRGKSILQPSIIS